MSLRPGRYASKKKKKEEEIEKTSSASSSSSCANNNPHGSQTAATSAFRRWLVLTFGASFLRGGSGVLDVAGGKGRLSFELLNLEGVKSTVVDPRKDANYAKMVRQHARMALRRRRQRKREGERERKERSEEEEEEEEERNDCVPPTEPGAGDVDEGEERERRKVEVDDLKLEDIPYQLPLHICKYWEPKLWQSIRSVSEDEKGEGEREREREDFVLWSGYTSLCEKSLARKRQEEKLKTSWEKAYGSHTVGGQSQAAPQHLRRVDAAVEDPLQSGETRSSNGDLPCATAEATATESGGEKKKKKKNEKNNKKEKGVTSRYRGVFFDGASDKWCATIQRKGERVSLGTFDLEVEAALAFDQAMREKLGRETAHVNFHLDGTENATRLRKDQQNKGKEKKRRLKMKKDETNNHDQDEHEHENEENMGMTQQQQYCGKDKDVKEEVVLGGGCWKCGPFDRNGCPRGRAMVSLSHHEDGFSGWAQHKAFHCPLAAQMSKKSGSEIHPKELQGEESIADVLVNCSVVVGLHPDQATGDIVDFALELGKPFAIVPCCTFKDTFRHRKLKTGERVQTYSQLVQWILEKDTTQTGRIQKCVLDFAGRNVVLYSLGG